MTLATVPALETLLLIALAAVGVYHLVYVGRSKLRRMQYRASDVRDHANQLRFVMAASFERKKVMAFSEYKVFKAVEDEVATRGGHRVFAQTSLGEILRSADDRAHSSINSKRVDILVIAPDGYPLVAVEYQGDGHFQGSAAARDAVKKEALRKAGVQYVEISKRHTPDEIRGMVRSALGPSVRQVARPASPAPATAPAPISASPWGR